MAVLGVLYDDEGRLQFDMSLGVAYEGTVGRPFLLEFFASHGVVPTWKTSHFEITTIAIFWKQTAMSPMGVAKLFAQEICLIYFVELEGERIISRE